MKTFMQVFDGLATSFISMMFIGNTALAVQQMLINQKFIWSGYLLTAMAQAFFLYVVLINITKESTKQNEQL